LVGARIEDTDLHRPREPRHRPPDQAHAAPARPHPRRRARRVHQGADIRGSAASARGMTVRDMLVTATEKLERAGVPSPRVDAEWLLAHALGITRTELYADGDEAPAEKERVFRDLVARRAAREPLAYVL